VKNFVARLVKPPLRSKVPNPWLSFGRITLGIQKKLAMQLTKLKRRKRIHSRVRKSISGTPEQPRLNIFRSNKFIYAQLIDDVNGVTLAQASSFEALIAQEGDKASQSTAVGKLIAERGQAAGVSKVLFDRGGYLFHGRVKALADGAREGGLKF
jgi:large subunit ribosomal protein L18